MCIESDNLQFYQNTRTEAFFCSGSFKIPVWNQVHDLFCTCTIYFVVSSIPTNNPWWWTYIKDLNIRNIPVGQWILNNIMDKIRIRGKKYCKLNGLTLSTFVCVFLWYQEWPGASKWLFVNSRHSRSVCEVTDCNYILYHWLKYKNRICL
jgi:hypothetical protein